MNTNETRNILLAKKAEVEYAAVSREDLTVAATPDPFDFLQVAGARDFAVDRLNRNTRVKREVRLALQRLDEGEYGVCLDCEEPISAKRLHAVPWAIRCVHCQSEFDEAQKAREYDSEFADAA